MRISIIVAMAENRVIGLDGAMPWYISADLKYFKRLTMGAPVIMGRKTYNSIGRALPGRINVVITRNPEFSCDDAEVAGDIVAALRKAKAFTEIKGGGEIFVIGGAEIYAQALNTADRLYITEIKSSPPGDAYFPELAYGSWREVSRDCHESESTDSPAYSFVVLERIAW